jgi:prepilin-type N-terminal cleavage/methylation domain-containing protein
MKRAFTLIELLIVIALLAGIAMIVIPNLVGNKQEVTEVIIQSELAEIQRAFFRFKNDCALNQNDYQKVAQYGIAVLLEQKSDDFDNSNGFSFSSWDNDRQRGWRGQYLIPEDKRNINPDSTGQQNGDVEVPVICCSENNSDALSDYYRILATDKDGNILKPNATDFTDKIHQLWVVYPYFTNPPLTLNNENKKYYRQLLAEEVTKNDEN